ncbi:MAG: DUF883 C-terminal domain-containing protein [Alphaproteobacteria bacterium]|nr:DUF883 C-terminal domain-containing protein [Alphaproteobacteria bacterium]
MSASDHEGNPIGDAKERLGSMRDEARETAGKVRNDLQGLAYDAGHMAKQYVEAGQRGVRKTACALAETIQKKPLQSSAIAVGIGLVMGMLMRRRS